MERISTAISEILLKQELLIPFTYRNIGIKYNVAESTLRHIVWKYGRKQPDLNNFFIGMFSRSLPAHRTHIVQIMNDIKELSARNDTFNKFLTDKKEREKEMAEGAKTSNETCYDEYMKEQEVKNLQEKWHKQYLQRYEEYQMELEDLEDFEHLINFEMGI